MHRNTIFLAIFLAASLPAALFADNKQKAYEASSQQARQATDIYSAGPLQMRASFHLQLTEGRVDGSYQYVQLSKDEYLEEVHTSDFSESILSKQGERNIARSKELEPLPVWYLREVIRLAHSVPANAPVSKITTSVQNGQNTRCFTLERGPYPASEYSGHETCFDAETGVLVSIAWSFNSDTHRVEFSKFLQDGTKLFPGTIRRFHNGNLLEEIRVDSLSHTPPDPRLLASPPNGAKQDACKRFTPAEVEYSHEYFQIRSDYKSGSVVIAGRLDDHGKVRETEIQQSAGPERDAAAARALKEVHARPAKCDGRNVASFFRLQIWFSPALHPDSFQSFR